MVPARACAPAAVLALLHASPARAESDLGLYGDINGTVATTGTRAGTEDGFNAAKLDLFWVSTAGRWSFLAEAMFEAGDENAFALDVERVQVSYLVREWLRVSAGRFHTALGYYNDAFHHGTYFMVPVGRPTMVEFEDGGGLIPAHNVGVHADGRFALGGDHLRYDLELANGRGSEAVMILDHHDTNRPKVANLRVRYEPGGALEGLVIGGNVYFDGIAGITPATAAGGGPPARSAIHEWIFGAHAAYLERGVHFVAEAMLVQHTELDTGTAHRSYAAFGEFGRSYGDVTPYARYEWVQFPDEGDPYYQRAAGDGYQTVLVGVKHSTSENVALKAQAAATFSPAPGSDPLFTFTGQIAFAF